MDIEQLDARIPGGVKAIWNKWQGKGPTEAVDKLVVKELSRLARDEISMSAWKRFRTSRGWRNTYRSWAQREAARNFMEGPRYIGGMQGLSRRHRPW